MHVSNLIHQKSYEKVNHILRRHPLTFLPQIGLLLLLLSLPIFIYFITISSFPTLLNNDRLYASAVLAASIYYLSVYLFFFTHFIDYYLDIWIVTNDRIVDVEQFGLFSRTISELDLFRIQDVTTDVHGFFPTFFNYGDVSVKTASQNLDIIFRNVSNPNHIRQQLLHLADIDRQYHYPEVKSDKGMNEL